MLLGCMASCTTEHRNGFLCTLEALVALSMRKGRGKCKERAPAAAAQAFTDSNGVSPEPAKPSNATDSFVGEWKSAVVYVVF